MFESSVRVRQHGVGSKIVWDWYRRSHLGCSTFWISCASICMLVQHRSETKHCNLLHFASTSHCTFHCQILAPVYVVSTLWHQCLECRAEASRPARRWYSRENVQTLTANTDLTQAIFLLMRCRILCLHAYKSPSLSLMLYLSVSQHSSAVPWSRHAHVLASNCTTEFHC